MPDDRDPSQKAEPGQKLEATGAAAAGGLGCLGAALMPWIVIVGVLAIILVAWIVGRAIW